ncbi:MAG TPA: sulfite exporter TauE/SafE family protein [Propionibacteriaceae bacterium]|nr:sulfite exporter TauE/SafE family protein [Propionibacteriaceae bacterium]
MGWGVLTLLAGFVLIGASAQRITGMGFALVASPFLVLVLGPANAVPLTITLGTIATVAVLLQVWRDVEPRTALLLLVPAILGILPGRWVAERLPPSVLGILIGVLVMVAVLSMVVSPKAHILKGRPGAVVAGFLSGFMNATAGVGGPAIVLYALSTKWRHEAFVATTQVYFLGLSVATLLALDPVRLPLEGWAAALSGLALGLLAGTVVARHVTAAHARTAVVVLALAGSAATVVKGVIELLA